MRKKIKNSKIVYKVYEPIRKPLKTKKLHLTHNVNYKILDRVKKLIRTHKLTTGLIVLTSLLPLLVFLPKTNNNQPIQDNTNVINLITNVLNKNNTTTNSIIENITKYNTNTINKEVINIPKSLTVTNYIILLNNNSTNKNVKSYTIGGSKSQPNFIDTDNQSFNYNSFIVPYVIDRYFY